MRQSITIRILEVPPQNYIGSIGGYVEDREVDDVYDKDIVLGMVIDSFKKANNLNTPTVLFGVTDKQENIFYRGTIQRNGKKISLSGTSIQ